MAARSELESRLSKVWASVLGLERVGVNDNFFELGGDSILCIQVVSRAKAAGVQITVSSCSKIRPSPAGSRSSRGFRSEGGAGAD